MLAESLVLPMQSESMLISLTETLRTEARLLSDLVTSLRKQRVAVAANDLAKVDEATFGMHRVLFTLAEARRVRHQALRCLGVIEHTPVHAITDAVGRSAPLTLHTACDDVLARAETAAMELATNRQVLRGAIDVGDSLVRVLAGISASSAQTCAPRGAFFNRNA